MKLVKQPEPPTGSFINGKPVVAVVLFQGYVIAATAQELFQWRDNRWWQMAFTGQKEGMMVQADD